MSFPNNQQSNLFSRRAIFGYLLAFAIFSIWIIISLEQDKNRLIDKGVVVIGMVYQVGPNSRSGSWYKYFYYYNNSRYDSEYSHVEIPLSQIRHIKQSQKPILVILDSLQPEFSKPLILKEDFRKYNLPFPDSMAWIYDYEK